MDYCSQHPSAQAGWKCSSCERLLCPECAATDVLHRSNIVRCTQCGNVAREVMVPRDVRPYWVILPELLSGIFRPFSLLMLAGLVLMMGVASFVPIIGGLLRTGIFAGYLFLVIRRASGGVTSLPGGGDFSNVVDDIFLPAVRFILATAIIWIPSIAYITFKLMRGGNQDPAALFFDPVFLLILAASVAYLPGAIIVAAISESTFAAFNPANVLAIVTRVPSQYSLTAAICAVAYLVRWGIMAVVSLMVGGIPFLGWLIVTYVGIFIPMFLALILGRLIFQNSAAFGLTIKGDDVQPAMPDARPRGSVPADRIQAREQGYSRTVTPPPAAVELSAADPAMEPRPAFTQGYSPPPEAVELSPDPLAGPPPDGASFADDEYIPQEVVLPTAPQPAPAPEVPGDRSPLPSAHESIAGDIDNSSIAGAMYDPGRETSAAIAAITAAGLTPFQKKSGPLSLNDNVQLADPMEPLRAALDRNDEAGSVQAYHRLMGDGVTPDLEPPLELRLTQFLGNANLYSDAVLSCRRAAGKQPDGPMAPAATFTAARLMAEKLQQPEQAKALLQFMLDNYPDSPLCNHARQLLQQMGG